MSPSGDAHPARSLISASDENLSSEAGQREGTNGEVLPLRLSVARGGLGIELARPLRVGPLICEHLDTMLLGVSYPVDLSKGVKQFRSRRSELRCAGVEIELAELETLWARSLDEVWGELPRVRLMPADSSDESATSVSANHSNRFDRVGVSIFSIGGILSFDLVVSSGKEPSLVVDQPRKCGRLKFLSERSALQAALAAVDAGLKAVEGGLSLARLGRCIQVSGLARALCLGFFPALGFRLPRIENQVVARLDASAGRLRFELSSFEEPLSVGFRSLHLASVAGFFVEADERLSRGCLEEARGLYMKALDVVPGFATLLLDIVDIDLALENRAESAYALIEELDGSEGGGGARGCLLASLAMRQMNRGSAAHEELSRALDRETDPAFFSYLCCTIAEETLSQSEASRLLDQAVSRSPTLELPRRRRFQNSLTYGDVETARRDAAFLEAECGAPEKRVELLRWVSKQFSEAGHEDEAMRLMRRALRLCPQDADVMMEYAFCLDQGGEHLRAAELLTSAVRTLENRTEEGTAASSQSTRDSIHRCHFALSKILARHRPDSPGALLHLGRVPTRSRWGGEARLLEVETYQSRGNRRERDHALSRLVEAVQLGWIKLGMIQASVERVLKHLTPPPAPELIQLLVDRSEEADSPSTGSVESAPSQNL